MKRYSIIGLLACTLTAFFLTLAACGKQRDVAVQVRFKPVITAIGAQRSGSNVTFTASVSDAGPLDALTYSWGFDGGLAFINSTTNSAVLQGYGETTSGNLTLTVTNSTGGATTVSYYIAPGLLPDDVVIVVARTEKAILHGSVLLLEKEES